MIFDLNVNEFELSNIYIKDFIQNKGYMVGYSIYFNILNNKENYIKLVNGLLNNNILNIDIFIKGKKILEVNKILFLESIFNYLEKSNDIKNNLDLKQELLNIESKLNYKNNINLNEIYKINIENNEYIFNVHDFFTFMELSDDLYNKIILDGGFLGIKIEYFVYGLVNYFSSNNLFLKYKFSNNVRSRFLNLLNYKDIDYEALNKILKTKDSLQGKINLSSDITQILNTKYDDNILKNLIKCYLQLCKTFNYDEIYYLDENNKSNLKHHDYTYISKINKQNNKIVCFEFISIFGYFLNNLGINYEILESNNYGVHSYLIFRFNKYLVKIEAIKSVFDNDLTNIRINYPLIGIECINQNDKTKQEFNEIINSCYRESKMDLSNDFLPANKVEYNQEDDNSFNNVNEYIVKIDLIVKKLGDLELSVIDKLSYFKVLVKTIFTSKELDVNVFYTTLSSYNDFICVFALNKISYQNSDNIYLIYEKNTISIINKETLQERINNGELIYLTSKEIPGISKNKIK